MAIAPALGPMIIVWTVQGAARAPSAAPRAYTLALWYARATTSRLAGEPAGSPYITYDHQSLPRYEASLKLSRECLVGWLDT